MLIPKPQDLAIRLTSLFAHDVTYPTAFILVYLFFSSRFVFAFWAQLSRESRREIEED